jgi:predicted acylesterase/phospholipase RssA
MEKNTSTRPCDLVMKGGITSGIVYPPAVLALKEHYTFRNIGGTSAGAIAAVGTAAAEYNRDGGGFERLDAVKEWLSKDTNLLHLFQASPETQPLLDILLAGLDTGANGATTTDGSQAVEEKPFPLFLRFIALLLPGIQPKILPVANRLIHTWTGSYKALKAGGQQGMKWGIVSGLIVAAILALFVLCIVFAITPAEGTHNLWIPLVAFVFFAIAFSTANAWLGMWIGRVVSVFLDFDDLISKRLPANGYGICTGHTSTAEAEQPGVLQLPNLTDWLSDIIDKMAGLAPQTVPLTFGQLQGKQIGLKMLTSNLSHGLPYVLPHGLENFIFNASEMERFFPRYIVNYLCKHAPRKATQKRASGTSYVVPPELLPEGYYFLPDAEKIPVVVGARLSLSYPILLSALPLYTVSMAAAQAHGQNPNQERLGEQDLQKNWFSDGGICSNFPIQFFDAWLPNRPTFGINLTSVRNTADTSALEAIPEEKSHAIDMSAEEQNEKVYLPRAEEYQGVEWQHMDKLQTFLWAIFGTAQNYRDTTQTNLPSYRERVVQIRLDATEGGLNLAMPESAIKSIIAKGEEAGKILSPTSFSFDHHWWVRFLVLTAQLEENAEELQHVLKQKEFKERLEKQWRSNDGSGEIYPYYRSKEWCEQAEQRIADIQRWVKDWQVAGMQSKGAADFFRHDAPLANPVLRVTPEV